MKTITVAICVYNGADRITDLVEDIRRQDSDIPTDILIVDNNSTDNTYEIAASLARTGRPPVRIVSETQQGIPFARNRAIAEAKGAYLAFIDIDERPNPGWLNAAADALSREGAQCVGGPIRVDLPEGPCPAWLDSSLLGFLGEVDHGSHAFWITNDSTPVWSGNVAYDTALFKDGLQFDSRYNRKGKGVGGGSDAIMFRTLLRGGTRLRYRPDMQIRHCVEPWRIRRRYFLRLHYLSGYRRGLYELPAYSRSWLGVPPFLIRQFGRQMFKTISMIVHREPAYVRQAMNATHALGLVVGYHHRQRQRFNV